jgi:hypothetical protein
MDQRRGWECSEIPAIVAFSRSDIALAGKLVCRLSIDHSVTDLPSTPAKHVAPNDPRGATDCKPPNRDAATLPPMCFAPR